MRISKSCKDSVEKVLPSKGDLSDREELIKLASETAAEEKDLSDFGDMKYTEALERFKKNNTYSYQIIVGSKSHNLLSKHITRIKLYLASIDSKIKWYIDIDPTQ